LVELYLAKVVVAGSSPVSRSIFFIALYIRPRNTVFVSLFTLSHRERAGVRVNGDVPKWLRGRSAKPLFSGSNPLVASTLNSSIGYEEFFLF
jgi:hypothetical protein